MKKCFLFGLTLILIIGNFKGNAQKPLLDHSVYDNWQSINETVVQSQGKFIVYSINPQEGDANLIVKQLNSNWELTIPRGTQPVFTENGEYLITKIKPFFADTRKAKIDKKKSDELPKDSLFILNLVSKKIQKIASVKSFQVPELGNDVIAYLQDRKGDINKEGSVLFIQALNDTIRKEYKHIAQYAMNPSGNQVLMYQINTKQMPAQVILANTIDSNIKILSSHLFSATNLTWDESGNQAAFLIEPDSTSKALQKNYKLAYFKQGMDSANKVLESNHVSLPSNYVFGSDRKLHFSKSGQVLELGIQPLLPIKDTSLPEFERVSLDIWNYNDDNIQSIQLKNLDANLKSTETVLYRPENNSVVYLGKYSEQNIKLSNQGDGVWAIATNDSANTASFQWQGFVKKDIIAINTLTASPKLIHKNWKGSLLSVSPDGSKIIYYVEPEKKYYAYDLNSNKKQIIAKDILFPLFDEDNDMPDDPNAYGIAKWMENNYLLIYDRFDIWKVDINGLKPSLKLTNGRASSKVYRYVDLDGDKKFINSVSDTLLLQTMNEKTKSESIEVLYTSMNKVFLLNEFPMHLTTIVKSKMSNELFVMQEDEKSSPNLYHYTFEDKFQNPTPLTQINPQQANFNWMTSELVKWKSYTGKIAEGILYKPENFDPAIKYPMIVYFYERNNQTLHNYLPPTPARSRINIPYFVSRGYVVFVPDIWYKKGYPGQGAFDYIVSGTKAMIQKGFIDSTKIGLQGQSWGGYQIAYLVTKTNMFAAAWAGAPVVNMTSAYGGIRWGTGMNRQFQYEKTQSRIGATLWERPDLYIKNSPLFSLPNVTTPIVIMNNDADDAVPWYQGIEMFTAMKRLNKKIWLLVYNNELHNLSERRNKKDIQIRQQQFFDHYLKNEAMPIWMSDGVPAIMKGRTMGLGY